MPDRSSPPFVLVVDQEAEAAELVVIVLRHHGFDAHAVDTGRAAMQAVRERQPDLLLMEADLPDLDGFDVARRLRELEGSDHHVPVIFLSARCEPGDRTEGLRLGADDYVAKPFSPAELVERVRAVLRRCGHGDTAVGDRLIHDVLVLDPQTYEVWSDGKPIELTPTEHRLLHYLLSNARQVLTRDQLLAHVWGYDFGGNASVLETYISSLRQKLGDPSLIHTVRGVGYTLRR